MLHCRAQQNILLITASVQWAHCYTNANHFYFIPLFSFDKMFVDTKNVQYEIEKKTHICSRLDSRVHSKQLTLFYSNILLIHIWVNLQSFVCSIIPIVQWCLIGTYSKHMTVCFLCLITLPHRFSPSCSPIHLHILMRWSWHSNSRLWSHHMPVPCVHFPLFVSPWPRTHMEAWAVSCRQAWGGMFPIINLMQD